MSILMPIGKVNKLFGQDGQLAITIYEPAFDIDKKTEPLFVKIDELAVPLFIESISQKGKNGAVVRFDDIDTTKRAGELVGLELFAASEAGKKRKKEDDAEDEGEVFWEDLIGYKLILAVEEEGKIKNSYRGEINDFFDNDMNPLFSVEIKVDGKAVEMLIPAAEEMIESLDTEKEEIEMVIPDGLIELYL